MGSQDFRVPAGECNLGCGNRATVCESCARALATESPAPAAASEERELYPVLSMSKPHGRAEEWQVPLWEAIHDYARGVGGNPDRMHVGLNGVTLTDAAARVGHAVEVAIRMAYQAGRKA